MLSKLKKLQAEKSGQEGFTIIEVMIVLAIAGLIILIVLLAVPNLQRNGRNTAIKSDAGQLLGYIADFSANNDGAAALAANSSVATGNVSINNATGTAATGKIQTGTTVTLQQGAAAVTPAAGAITIAFGAACPTGALGAAVTPVVNSRAVAIIYAIEATSSTLSSKCVGS
jgi:prepilin-type N-terminal cleavage/methylation domain-containing protein